MLGVSDAMVPTVAQLSGQPMSRMRVTTGPSLVLSHSISKGTPMVGKVAELGAVTGLNVN